MTVTAVLLLAACGPPAEEPPNLLFVLVDTLRADRMSLYGHGRPTTPFLDELAGEGVVFERAYSQAGCTFPSVASMLTSRHPIEIAKKRTKEKGFSIPDDLRSLPEILEAEGYQTFAVSASTIIRKTPSKINPSGFGYDRGYSVFDESCEQGSAACVGARARQMLSERWTGDRPFFLYLHYYDPHNPYRPPEDHQKIFPLANADHGWARNGHFNPIARYLYRDAKEPENFERSVQVLRDLYDEEVRYFDARFRELMAWLEEEGLRDDLVIVLASDHGEELYEHGDFGHCRNMTWETVTRVPLVVWAPGLEATRRQEPVENLDVTPTLLDLLGFDLDSFPELEGRSLRPVLEDPLRRLGEERPLAFTTQGVRRSVVSRRFKLTSDRRAGHEWLFDLEAGQGEAEDVREEHERIAEVLARELERWEKEHSGGGAAAIERAEEIVRELEAIGYL